MDDASQSVLRVLRNHFERSRLLQEAWRCAPEVAIRHLCRSGWPGESLRETQKKQIIKELSPLASSLAYANDMKSLAQFAQKTVLHLLTQVSSKSRTEIETGRLVGFIKAEQHRGERGETAATRAAARFLQQKRRAHKQTTYIAPNQYGHLQELLSLPKSTGTELPKQDIRGLILKSSLSGLLQKASCFAPEVLRPVLGDMLFRQIKPVGFADQTQKSILIQVESSAIAHEMLFRKLEILKRLQQIPEFRQVNDLRFVTS